MLYLGLHHIGSQLDADIPFLRLHILAPTLIHLPPLGYLILKR